jgi:thiamine-monophosphate kinase
VLGIGDDCAVFRAPPGQDLVFTTDLLLEDVHFLRGDASPEFLGRKTLTRGLSDIAAMGARPRFCLLSLAVPEWAADRWIEQYFQGVLELGVPLAGGDLARAAKMAADIVVCGSVPRGQALRRDTARAGDAIFVSGPLGAAASQGYRHLGTPRLKLGQALRRRATACIDLSDGLSLDLHRLAEPSGLAAEIGPPPVFPGATLEQALDGGEDYELLFTADPRRIPKRWGTRIGTMRKGKAGTVLLDGRPLPPRGYDHFARPRSRP